MPHLTMMQWVYVILAAVLVLGSVAVVVLEDLLSAVIVEGVVSLHAALIFLFMSSADVAMTQAVVGAGLSTAVFLWILSRAGYLKWRSPEGGKEGE